jgi:hypothetical protein
MEEKIYGLRNHALNRTLVIVMNLQDTEVVQKYGMDSWHKQLGMDPDAIIPDPLLYIVWNKKTAFVKHVISLNPFKSSHFFWMDIGHLRDSIYNGYNGNMLINDATPFYGDKVLIADATYETTSFWNPFTVNENRVAAGMFGGTTAAMLRFYSEYYKTLDLDMKAGLFVGNDQIVFFRTCMRNDGICKLLQPTAMGHCYPWLHVEYMSNCNVWIYMSSFLKQKLWREP